jgi:acetoacetyl-CoA synthase
VVLGRVPTGAGMLASTLLTRGDQHALMGVPAGGSRFPASLDTLRAGGHFFTMDGRAVRAFVQEQLPAAVNQLLAKAHLAPQAVDHFVPHQANSVLLDEVWPDLALGSASLHLVIKACGNTGAASIPITLDLVHRKGLLAERDAVVLCGFGGGMSVGSTLLRWAPTPCARPARSRVRVRELALAR